MTNSSVDATTRQNIAKLGEAVLEGQQISRDDALWLFGLQNRNEIFELLIWANRIREHFKGSKIHLCSIVNVKAGVCPENCRFCAQSAFYQTGSPRHELMEPGAVRGAAEEARRNGVAALGVVAAWRGMDEGPLLDRVCEQLQEIRAVGGVRADGSLGMIRKQSVAQQLRAAGLECYNHNLETSRRFFPEVCMSHSYDDRIRTLGHLRGAGIKLCSGGIIGMGETRQDRCDLALALREQGVHVVPINILNPIEGTPFAGQKPVPPLEALKTIACFRFILPRQEITVAGGRTVNLRDTQSMMFMAGASAVMVGNYLTTMGQPVQQDLQMIRDLGLDPKWDRDGFCDQDAPPAAC